MTDVINQTCKTCTGLGFVPGQIKRNGTIYDIGYACPDCALGTDKHARLQMMFPPVGAL